ncbi:MAG: DUF2782 domain-containing protein [Gammaproteobacteria bacterium]|nr:DUF2782 domain-containing protein [Gammaproteobacteria bacterium]
MHPLISTLLQPAFQHANRVRSLAQYARKLPIWTTFTCGMLITLLATTNAFGAEASALEDLKGPDVTIIAGEDRTVYEFRQGGELRMVKIIPKWGKPYFLVPRDRTSGFGNLERAETLLPSWVIIEF